jgi:hypothetical protein
MTLLYRLITEIAQEEIDSAPEIVIHSRNALSCTNYPKIKWGAARSFQCAFHKSADDSVVARLEMIGEQADISEAVDLLTQWAVEHGAEQIKIKRVDLLTAEQFSVLKRIGFEHEMPGAKDWRERAVVLDL